ncbi:hypothetical protein [Acidovorax sp.]|uniref:hypothetical protein n=1 Tax=Acidovorax sp. TaxID=1872122 RepID=UPI002FA7CFD1
MVQQKARICGLFVGVEFSAIAFLRLPRRAEVSPTSRAIHDNRAARRVHRTPAQQSNHHCQKPQKLFHRWSSLFGFFILYLAIQVNIKDPWPLKHGILPVQETHCRIH